MKRLKKAVYSACFIAGAVQLTACTQKLYGPPPTSAAVSPTEEVLPTEEVPEVVYGPPEMFDIEENAEKAESTASAEEKK